MQIVVSGASGLIGTNLVAHLRVAGHEVRRLVRRPVAAADELTWDPAARRLDPAVLTSTDAVIHLAGVGIGDKRWTKRYKQSVLRSRVDGTTTISEAVAAAEPGPRVLLSMSGAGWYGDTGGHAVDETGQHGVGFLAEVTEAWEAATHPAQQAGVRVVRMRTGPVLTAQGGTLGRMLPLAKLGLLSPLGSGRQFISWVSLADQLDAIGFLLASDDISGPVNVTGPQPATMAELTNTLLRVLRRPRMAPNVPAFALRAVLGGFADEGVLISQRVVPGVLSSAGYAFAHETVEHALRWATGRPR
ncbi:MAG: TIGR01777 family oxidoreductase [Mycobacteriales bacterium]